MIGRKYTVSFTGVAVTAQQDFFYVSPADDKPCVVYGLFIGQQSEEGDTQAEMLPYRVVRGHSTVGSGGSAPTPRSLDPGAAAAAFTARVNDTTIASAGTPVDLHADAFNVQAGEKLWLPEDAMWLVAQPESSIVVRLVETPADSITMSGTLYVAEIGG